MHSVAVSDLKMESWHVVYPNEAGTMVSPILKAGHGIRVSRAWHVVFMKNKDLLAETLFDTRGICVNMQR